MDRAVRLPVALVVALLFVALPRDGSPVQTSSLPSQWIDIGDAPRGFDRLVADARRAAAAEQLWIGYTFALREGIHIGCSDRERHSVSFGGDVRFHIAGDGEGRPAGCDDDFGLFLRFEGATDEVVEARLMSMRRAARRLEDPVVWASELNARDSVSWLRDAVLGRAGGLRAVGERADRTRRRLLGAVAVHDAREAAEVVSAALDPSQPSELRESAVFWTAQVGGEDGLERLLRLARNDADSEVRQQAVFWLAQAAGERATADLAEIAAGDPDTEVRTAAVFALTQTEDDAAIDALIEIVRTNDNREVVKSALFWLGQSGDARAVALIEEILFGRTR